MCNLPALLTFCSFQGQSVPSEKQQKHVCQLCHCRSALPVHCVERPRASVSPRPAAKARPLSMPMPMLQGPGCPRGKRTVAAAASATRHATAIATTICCPCGSRAVVAERESARPSWSIGCACCKALAMPRLQARWAPEPSALICLPDDRVLGVLAVATWAEAPLDRPLLGLDDVRVPAILFVHLVGPSHAP